MAEYRKYDLKILTAGETSLAESEIEEIKERALINERFNVQELEKNEDERHLIANLNTALAKVMEQFGAEPLEVPPERIHILDENEFNRILEPEDDDTAAFFVDGHIYVQRGADKDTFIRQLSHEMAHEASYVRMTIKAWRDDGGVCAWGKTKIRRGVSVRLPQKEQFRGVYEALTEDVGSEIRMEYAKLLNMNDEDAKVLARMHSYVAHIYLMDEIYKLVGDGDLLMGREFFQRDYFTGTMTGFKKLSTKHKGAVKVLLSMGRRNEDVVGAARELGFDNIIQKYSKKK